MKKSKFLKKSLAMLLAVMLVVAMIPLSASAAPADDLEFIKVNGTPVTVEDGTLGVTDLTADVNVALAADITEGAELRAIPTSSQVKYTTVTTGGVILEADDYVTVNGDEGTIKLQLVDTTTQDASLLKEYTITLTKVNLNTATDIQVVDTHRGVYSAEVDNEKHVVNVVLARHDWENNAYDADAQENLESFITVSGVNGATVVTDVDRMRGNQVNVDDGDTFVVKAQNGSETTWHVSATYLDALRSFSLNGVDGQIENKLNVNDNIVDTITVVLPSSSLYDEDNWGDLITAFDVDYEVEGDVHCTVDMTFPDYASEAAAIQELETNLAVEGQVLVTRLDGAIQYYKLVVELEKSDATDITYARFNRTTGTVDLDARTVTAELPQNVNGAATEMDKVEVVLYTPSTVTDVVLDGTTPFEEYDEDGLNDEGAPAGGQAWRLPEVDLNTTRIVTVYAQDGQTSKQYQLSASWAGRVDEGKLESFYLVDPNGKAWGVSSVTGKTVTVQVPYMTLDVGDWTVLAKASSGAKVQVLSNGTFDLINGVSKGADVGFWSTSIIPTNGSISADFRVVDKFDDERVFEEYTVNVELLPAAEGDTIENLRFTAQPTTELPYSDTTADARGDKQFFRAIERDVNEFGAEVYTETDSTKKVGTINLPIPKALQTNSEADYTNVVTSVSPLDNALVFVEGANGNQWLPISVLTNDDSDALTASTIETGDKIVVMREEVARWAYIESLKQSNQNYYKDGAINLGTDLLKATYATSNGQTLTVEDVVTVYTVDLKTAEYSSDNEMSSFSVGNSELEVDTINDVISGELAWGLTTDDETDASYAQFATFELDDYAVLSNSVNAAGNSIDMVYFYSDGDVDGDGTVDPSNDYLLKDGQTKTNRKFLFVRNDDHSVTVYRATEDNVYDEIDSVAVLAEDRLASGSTSSRTYTFDLTWAEPETEADILTFSLDGYTGTVDNSDPFNRTITVNNVPYGTDLTGMIAEFTTTPNAKVYLTNAQGVLLESGVTSVNYTNPVLLYVLSEDGLNSNSYTVTINMGLTFSDINSTQWWYDDVVAAANNGYIHGRGNGVFDPTGEITRAEFATMIANAMNYEDKPESPAAFTDVNGHWAEDAINFCAENGIIDGYADCSFRPDQTITRQEVAAILARAFDLVEESNEKYTDDNLIPEWSRDYVYLAKGSELMNGDAKGTFRPTDTLIRAEAATILMNCNRAGVIN
mgnify:CR=1 FL=1